MTFTQADVIVILRLLTKGDFIPAIKYTRNVGQMGLKEAKDFCDQIRELIPTDMAVLRADLDTYKRQSERLDRRCSELAEDLEKSYEKKSDAESELYRLRHEVETLKKHKNILLEMLKEDLS